MTRPGTDPEPGILAAPGELLALAAAVRPAWDHDILAAAVTAAKNAGWTWDRTLAETIRLIRDPDGSPWDLKRAAADPFDRSVPPPGTEIRGAALARDLLEHRHDYQSTTACCPRQTIPDSCSCLEDCTCICLDCDCGTDGPAWEAAS